MPDAENRIFNALSLQFRDAALEKAYRAFHASESVGFIRFALVLAVILYLSFGAVDLIVTPAEAPHLWMIRSTVAAVCLLVHGISGRIYFTQYLQPIMAVTTLALGLGISAMLAVADPALVNSYYVGLILVCISTFTIIRLVFVNGLMVSGIVTASYFFVEIVFRKNPGYQVFSNSAFLVSAWLLSCIGGYWTEYQHRLAYYRNRLIDEAQQESRYLSLHDPLTLIGNRRLLMANLEKAIARAKRNKLRSALLFIDLDGFKSLNDAYGHEAGDNLLKSIAQLLERNVRGSDTAARFGGDEFVVLLEDLEQPEDAQRMATRIVSEFDGRSRSDEWFQQITLSIGIAVCPDHGDTTDMLLRHADSAMYQAKTVSGNSFEMAIPAG